MELFFFIFIFHLMQKQHQNVCWESASDRFQVKINHSTSQHLKAEYFKEKSQQLSKITFCHCKIHHSYTFTHSPFGRFSFLQNPFEDRKWINLCGSYIHRYFIRKCQSIRRGGEGVSPSCWCLNHSGLWNDLNWGFSDQRVSKAVLPDNFSSVFGEL